MQIMITWRRRKMANWAAAEQGTIDAQERDEPLSLNRNGSMKRGVVVARAQPLLERWTCRAARCLLRKPTRPLVRCRVVVDQHPAESPYARIAGALVGRAGLYQFPPGFLVWLPTETPDRPSTRLRKAQTQQQWRPLPDGSPHGPPPSPACRLTRAHSLRS